MPKSDESELDLGCRGMAFALWICAALFLGTWIGRAVQPDESGRDDDRETVAAWVTAQAR
jgi:hypothetical protein